MLGKAGYGGIVDLIGGDMMNRVKEPALIVENEL